MCTSWNRAATLSLVVGIITYWEMCTSWNKYNRTQIKLCIITYWEMCTSWNSSSVVVGAVCNYNLLGNVH